MHIHALYVLCPTVVYCVTKEESLGPIPSLRNRIELLKYSYEFWNFNSGNYLFTTDTK